LAKNGWATFWAISFIFLKCDFIKSTSTDHDEGACQQERPGHDDRDEEPGAVEVLVPREHPETKKAGSFSY
jgi:hypothetical protein